MIRSQVHKELVLVTKLYHIYYTARSLSSNPKITWEIKGEKNLLWNLEQILRYIEKRNFKGYEEEQLRKENMRFKLKLTNINIKKEK